MRWPAGFSLIELLVVLVIAAVLASLAALRLGDGRSSADPERQLARFAALLDAQCDAALLQSRPRGIRVTRAGYDFWQAAERGWTPVPASDLERPRQWSDPLEPRLFIDGRAQRLADDHERPQILCQPLGERTAFELELNDGVSRYRLAVSAGGSVTLQQGR